MWRTYGAPSKRHQRAAPDEKIGRLLLLPRYKVILHPMMVVALKRKTLKAPPGRASEVPAR